MFIFTARGGLDGGAGSDYGVLGTSFAIMEGDHGGHKAYEVERRPNVQEQNQEGRSEDAPKMQASQKRY